MNTTTEHKISSEESKQIAATILMQLGGRRFLVMTGSKPKYCDQYMSMYQLTRNKVNAKYMEITLNSLDLYDIVFFSVDKDFNRILKAERTGIYNDMLQETFTEVTGLYTHL